MLRFSYVVLGSSGTSTDELFTRCFCIGHLDSTFPIDARSILGHRCRVSGLRTEGAVVREIARHGDIVVREVPADKLTYFDIWRGETLLGAFPSETDALIVALDLVTFSSLELLAESEAAADFGATSPNSS